MTPAYQISAVILSSIAHLTISTEKEAYIPLHLDLPLEITFQEIKWDKYHDSFYFSHHAGKEITYLDVRAVTFECYDTWPNRSANQRRLIDIDGLDFWQIIRDRYE